MVLLLNEHTFKASYNKAEDNIADEFYLPCMRSSKQYDRISGYFGSTIYILAWSALREFIASGGKIRLICSPYISEEDEKALNEGYSARNNEIISDSIRREVENMLADTSLSLPSKLLAYLVSENIVDIKIAVPGNNSDAEIDRLFHDKVGIFYDSTCNMVGFRGSMNETFKGLSSDGNIESIDVFLSWDDERDKSRVNKATNYFNKLWHNEMRTVVVYPFPEASKAILKRYAHGVNWLKLLDEIQVIESDAQKWKPCKKPSGHVPLSHQTRALNAWIENNRRGIFEHATGSGKTFTAICAIKHALDLGDVVLVLVPSRELLVQWQNELQQALSDINVKYLLCGDNNVKWKETGSLHSWTKPSNKQRKIIIAIMDTACQPHFIQYIFQNDHLFVVADEVHRLGSRKRRQILQIQSGARLGLSATPHRYGDYTGTNAIFTYFGGIIPPPFTLEDAIKSGVLTKYFYYPQTLSLSDAEQEEWNNWSEEISLYIARTLKKDEPFSVIQDNPQLKRMLINRARIVKNACGKVSLAMQVLTQNYKKGQKWIIYCDNRIQLKKVLDEAIAAGYDAYEYFAEMDGNRETTLTYFEMNGGVLVSIKCLDEGVDIPSTTHALILASSQNPREFIQRRGRILRKSKDKYFARLYDAITMPVFTNDDSTRNHSIITAELSRAIQFGKSAENPACVAELKNIAIDYLIDYEKLSEGGFEDDDE